MRDAIHFVNFNSTEFILGLCALCLLLLIYSIILSRRVSKITKRRGQKAPGETVGEIIDCLKEQSRAIDDLAGRANDMCARLDEQASTLRKCLRRVGLVRFNAFDDVGGEQSFALVMLDDDSNGVAISSIYGRQDSRLYAKAIANANGERPLSDEERQALQDATSERTEAVEARQG